MTIHVYWCKYNYTTIHMYKYVLRCWRVLGIVCTGVRIYGTRHTTVDVREARDDI